MGAGRTLAAAFLFTAGKTFLAGTTPPGALEPPLCSDLPTSPRRRLAPDPSVDLSTIAAVLSGEMALFLLYKIARRDLQCWLPGAPRTRGALRVLTVYSVSGCRMRRVLAGHSEYSRGTPVLAAVRSGL
jgi:hypothetical protein